MSQITGIQKRQRRKWRKLENPAKIFPATSGRKDERVFRLACQMNEPVDQERLQQALDLCVKDYSLFLCVMRRGLFWNYLEETRQRPIVREEYKPPCSQLYVRDQKNLLFEVTYYKNRINFETYHALTDGTGAMQFMRTLLCYYLMKLHPDQVNIAADQVQGDATMEEMAEDSFSKYYSNQAAPKDMPVSGKAYQFHDRHLAYGNLRMTEGIMPVDKLLAAARGKGTTITVWLTAIFLCAIAQDMSPKQKKRPITLMIPVNLRNYFPSDSMCNFFGWINISYNFSTQSEELSEVIAYTADFFKKELTKERIAARMNGLVRMEKNFFMRVLPLPVKLLGMQAGAVFGTSHGTAVLSNVGKITMPEECIPYIDWFEVYTTTPKMEICTCSWQNKFTVSFTSVYSAARIERNFFRILTAQGIPVEIVAWSPNEVNGHRDDSVNKEEGGEHNAAAL
ncbi:MAG: hypothetical protein PHE06_12615 [Lachnospiraceae bacterium]|nr:hypothetical protein [Lachnospiraceae bacterium]MDD3796780.1 hypothetical protein [Lachnospiraceae bacterium]